MAEPGVEFPGPPGQRDTAAVAAQPRAAGAGEGGVLAPGVRNVDPVREAELFTLVEVSPAGQPQHEHGRRGRPGSSEVLVRLRIPRADSVTVARRLPVVPEAGGVADDVVVGEHPGAGSGDGVQRRQ